MSDGADTIENLIIDCAHAIDDGRLEAWPDFFTDDATYTITTKESYAKGLPVGVMNCTSRGMMVDRISALRRANVFEPHSYRHILSRSRITAQHDNVYDVRTNFEVIRIMQDGDMTLFACCSYFDRVVLEGDVARFKKRDIVCDSRRIDTLIVIPI